MGCWAVRLGNSEVCDDNREYGAAMHIMRAMREQNITDGVCIVSRWFGGVLMGRSRFDVIHSMAKKILRMRADLP